MKYSEYEIHTCRIKRGRHTPPPPSCPEGQKLSVQNTAQTERQLPSRTRGNWSGGGDRCIEGRKEGRFGLTRPLDSRGVSVDNKGRRTTAPTASRQQDLRENSAPRSASLEHSAGTPPRRKRSPPVGKNVVLGFTRVAGLRGPGFGERVLEPGNAPLQPVRHGTGTRVQVRLDFVDFVDFVDTSGNSTHNKNKTGGARRGIATRNFTGRRHRPQ